MNKRLFRSIQEPIREFVTWEHRWMGQDRGLVWCWERGRQYQIECPERAMRAANGELVPDGWRGGIEKKLKLPVKLGTLYYLATWQGMRGEDLDIDLEGERIIVCSRTNQAVLFSANSSLGGDDSEPEG